MQIRQRIILAFLATSMLFAAIGYASTLIPIFLVCASIATAAMGLFLARSISNSLTKLQTATSEIANGKLDTEITVKPEDEIGQLAVSFRKIVADLKRTNASIDTLHGEIARHKRIEEELRESEQRFKTIFDNAADGILLADPQTKKLAAGNKMICQMLGYKPDEIKNLTVMDIHPEQSVPQIMKQFDMQARQQITLAEDVPVKRKDGSVFCADINAFPVVIAGKTYLMGSFRDITQRKLAEQKALASRKELHDRHKFLSNVLESLTHPFYVIDANDYTIKMANSAAYSQILPEKATCYMISHDFNEPCRGLGHPCPLEEIKKTAKPVVVEHVHYDENGNPRTVEVHAHPIFDSEGNITQIIEYILDTTERRQAQSTPQCPDKELEKTAEKVNVF
jgi:PAS domain S-box-containing protein